jgi:hypothetical protein
MIIAITENAAGAHWAQTTLDTMWEFLAELPDKVSLAENKQASERLVKRMSMLALPAPKFAPFNGCSEKINKVNYRVREDNFILNGSAAMVSLFMGGTKLPKGIEEFEFDFEADDCTLHYLQEGEQKKIEIGMNGDYRRNIFGNGAVTIALMSGAWISEASFQLTTRWVETCNHQKLNFTFLEDTVIIEEEGEESLFLRKMPVVTATKK